VKNKVVNRKYTSATAKRIAIGTLVSLAMTLIITAVFAVMEMEELIKEENMKYCVIVILFLSALAGAKSVTGRNRDRNVEVGLLMGVTYACTLLSMNALIFSGQYHGVGAGIIMILSGCIVSQLLGRKEKKNIKMRRSKKRCG